MGIYGNGYGPSAHLYNRQRSDPAEAQFQHVQQRTARRVFPTNYFTTTKPGTYIVVETRRGQNVDFRVLDGVSLSDALKEVRDRSFKPKYVYRLRRKPC